VTLRNPREAPRPLVDGRDGVAVARVIAETSQRLRSIDQWPGGVATAEATPGVIAASPGITGAGFAVRADARSPIVVRGVEPERFLAIIDVRAQLDAGRYELDGGQVVIGSKLAAELGATIGDKLRITSSEGVEDVVTVRGIFTLGNEAVDGSWVLTTLRHAQALYGLPGGATTIELKVADVFAAERIAGELRARTGLRADSWMTTNAELLTGLTAQSQSKLMIQFFVIVAVTLGIASVLIVSVVQRSREIGILRAVGTPRWRISLIFLIQGGVLGIVGSIVGSALGALLARLFERLTVEASGEPRFPVQLDVALFASAAAIATGVGLVAAVLPARRAAKLDPAMAIRGE
jgi:lipoprotein-releasing system permease protein